MEVWKDQEYLEGIPLNEEAGVSIKVLPSKHRLSYAKAKVDVYKHMDGSLSILYKEEPLNFVPF